MWKRDRLVSGDTCMMVLSIMRSQAARNLAIGTVLARVVCLHVTNYFAAGGPVPLSQKRRFWIL